MTAYDGGLEKYLTKGLKIELQTVEKNQKNEVGMPSNLIKAYSEQTGKTKVVDKIWNDGW